MKHDDDDGLVRLYRRCAREKSPPRLDARVLEAAVRHARVRRMHLRLRKLAIAAAVGALAIAIPRWLAHGPVGQSPSDSARQSALVQAVMDLKVPAASGSAVTRCLLRNDLCADPTLSHR